MKKYVAFLLVMALIFALTGCCNFKRKSAYCYVQTVTDDGFLADLYEPDAYTSICKGVYIPYPDANKSISEYDTVVIEYNEANLSAQEGMVPGFEDLDVVYQYRYYLSDVDSARLADPSKGEPTFG